MTTIIIAVILLFAFMFIRFFVEQKKDDYDLQDVPLESKCAHLVHRINEVAYAGEGSITEIDKRSFNLYRNGSNQIVNFHYSTGHLLITWKYKYFQKEVIHERQFDDVRNLSLFDQSRLADVVIEEMAEVVQKHKERVAG